MDSKANESQIKKLKDLKSIEDLDLESVELIRGETPEDIKETCLQLCKDYLSGNWIQQTVDTIEIRRITGGLSNQLYYCAICEPLADCEVPQEVAVRIYGRQKWYNNDERNGNNRLTDIIISLMVSINKLGPKVFGLFESGEIQHFYKHRQFKLDEQKDPKLVKELFQKIARIHAMEVPIKKSHWILKEMDKFYEQAFKKQETHQLMDELNCHTLKTQDMKTEIQWLKDIVLKTKSPLVFSHNDLLSTNIMVLDNNDKNEEQIVLCDFEYSSYGYRGIDLGTVFYEWGRLWIDTKTDHIFPEDSVIEPLIRYYIEECKQIYGEKYSENTNNSFEQLLKESKVFVLVYKIFLILLCLKVDDKDNDLQMDRKVMMQLVEKEYQNYWRLKKQFVKQNLFN